MGLIIAKPLFTTFKLQAHTYTYTYIYMYKSYLRWVISLIINVLIPQT